MTSNDRRYPSEEQDRFIVRMPAGMRDQLKAEAEKNNRSMNSEVISRLSLTLRHELGEIEDLGRRTQLGPIADYIDDKFTSLSLELSDLKAQLGLDPLRKGGPGNPTKSE